MEDCAREPLRIIDGQFTQGWAVSVVQDRWTTEELMEHLTTARAVNDRQGEVMEELYNGQKTIEKVHDQLVDQFLKLATSTEDLNHRVFRIREQYKCRAISRDEGHRRDNAQAGTHNREQGCGNGGTASYEPEHKNTARKPSNGDKVDSQGHKIRSQSGGSAEQLEKHDEPNTQHDQGHHSEGGHGTGAQKKPTVVVNVTPNQKRKEATRSPALSPQARI